MKQQIKRFSILQTAKVLGILYAILGLLFFPIFLLATLEALPRTPDEPYWSCPEAAYAHVVLATDDARVWKAFEAAARRVDVGLRMQFLNPMN